MRTKRGIVEFGNKKALGHLPTFDGVADCDSKNAGTESGYQSLNTGSITWNICDILQVTCFSVSNFPYVYSNDNNT